MSKRWRYQRWAATRNCREMTINFLISIGIILHFLFHLHNLLNQDDNARKSTNLKHWSSIKRGWLGLVPLRQAALTSSRRQTSLFSPQHNQHFYDPRAWMVWWYKLHIFILYWHYMQPLDAKIEQFKFMTRCRWTKQGLDFSVLACSQECFLWSDAKGKRSNLSNYK